MERQGRRSLVPQFPNLNRFTLRESGVNTPGLSEGSAVFPGEGLPSSNRINTPLSENGLSNAAIAQRELLDSSFQKIFSVWKNGCLVSLSLLDGNGSRSSGDEHSSAMLTLWDRDHLGKLRAGRPLGFEDGVQAFAVSPLGNYVAVASQRDIGVYEVVEDLQRAAGHGEFSSWKASGRSAIKLSHLGSFIVSSKTPDLYRSARVRDEEPPRVRISDEPSSVDFASQRDRIESFSFHGDREQIHAETLHFSACGGKLEVALSDKRTFTLSLSDVSDGLLKVEQPSSGSLAVLTSRPFAA